MFCVPFENTIIVFKEDFHMKSLFNKYIWLQFILSILLLFGGALIIAFAIKDFETIKNGGEGVILSRGLDIIFAVILFLFGGFAIIASFAFEPNKIVTSGILYGSGCIAMGVFLCTDKFEILEYLVYLLAIFFIVIGTIEIIKAIILLVKKAGKLVILILSIILGALFVAGGILSIIFADKVGIIFCFIAAVILILIGIYLLVTGIMTIIGCIKGKDKPAKKAKDKKAEEEQSEPVETKELDYTEDKKQIEASEEKPAQ